MKKFIVEPLKGIGVINLGDVKSDVHSALGKTDTTGNDPDYYFENCLQVHYDKDNKVEFIEFCTGGPIEIEVFGANPFQLLANDLVNLLKEKNGPVFNKREAPFSYAFKTLSIGIFRESSEEDILESIEECKKEGTYKENEDWLLEDLEKFKYFQTLGIGVKGYYRKD
jgi:hypothetical protein